MFSRVDKAERIGSDIRRIMELMADAKLKDPIIESNAFFSVTFEREPCLKFDRLGSEENSVLGSDKIFGEIKKNPKIMASQLASKLGITPRAMDKQLAALKGWGKRAYVESNKAGH